MQNHKTNSIVKFAVTAILSIMLLFGFVLPTSIVLSNIQRYESLSVKAEGSTIEVQGLKTTYNIGDEVELPTVSGASITVKDPKNNLVALDGNKFTANFAGDYTVEYKNGDATTGEIYISVKASKASFNFNTANKKLLPSQIATNTDVVFPIPEILDEEGEVITGAQATLSIKKAGSSEAITLSETTENEVTYKKYKFATAGVYSVVYSFDAVGYNHLDKKYTIEVSEGYSDDIELTYTLNESMPTSLVQGVEVELPTVTGKDKKHSNANVDVYTTIEVEHLKSDGTYEPITVKDNKFTPVYAGTYRIKYTVTDFYGNTYQKVYDPIENVRDSRAPTIKIVSDYEIAEGGNVSDAVVDALQDLSANIPSVAVAGTEVTLPAIFASDNVAEFKDLSLRRLIKNGTEQIANLDDTSVEAYKDNKINKSVKYTFEKAGTYTIIYKASDNTNTTTDSLYSYTVVVKDAGFTDTIAPTVVVKEFVTDKDGASLDIAKPGDTVRIVKPNVVDYQDPQDPSNRDTNDTRPTLSVYAEIEGSAEAPQKLELSEDGTYYEYVIPQDATGRVVVTYKAQDCFGNVGNGDDVAGLIKYLDIVDTNETSLPTITNVEASLGSFDQYETIDLSNEGQISVSDSNDKNVEIKIIVSRDGEVVDSNLNTTTMLSKSSTGSTRSLLKADFTANRAGSYVVSYVAYDHAGNYSVQTATFSVASKETPVLVVNDYSSTMELGKAYIPNAKLYLGGELQEGANIITEVEGNINQIGTVKVTYNATASNGVSAEQVVITITVNDTVKPELSIDGQVPEYVDLVRDDADPENRYKEVELPGFVATDDGSKVDKTKYKITVKNKNDVEIATENSANGLTFRPTGDGKYTAIYSATDFAGNTITETYTINVGDVDRPKLEIKKEPATTATLKKGSYVWKVDTSATNIIVTDKVGDDNETLSNSDYLSVVVTNASGSTIEADEDTTNVFTLTEAGEYTMTITATDKAGNVTTETYTLKLSADDNNVSTTTEVLGTILLVVAILVLIGVIFYFVKPAPMSKKDKKKDAKRLNNEENK